MKTYSASHTHEERLDRLTSISCTVYGPDACPNGFTALASEWNNLLQRARFNSIFLTLEWQTTWWESLGRGDLWVVAFRSDSGNGKNKQSPGPPVTVLEQPSELVGIASLYSVPDNDDGNRANGKRLLTLVGCTEVSDYLDLVVARGWERPVHQAFLEWLQSDEAPEWDRLDLCNLPEDSLTHHLFPTLVGELPWTVKVELEDVAPQFDLPTRFETYLQTQVDKKQRHEIRRKQRRIERETTCEFEIIGQRSVFTADSLKNRTGVIVGTYSYGDTNRTDVSIDKEIDDFLRLQRASRVEKAAFMVPEMANFFHKIARILYRAGYLRLCFLKVNGAKAASLMAFEYDNKFLLYNSGYDPDHFAYLSPGWTLLTYTIQYTIAAGLKVYDFMQGDEEYKYRFGCRNYQVMRVIVEK